MKIVTKIAKHVNAFNSILNLYYFGKISFKQKYFWTPKIISFFIKTRVVTWDTKPIGHGILKISLF